MSKVAKQIIKLILFDLSDTLVYRKCGYSASSKIIDALALDYTRNQFISIYEEIVSTRTWQDKISAYLALCRKLKLPNKQKSARIMANIRDEADSTLTEFPHTRELLKSLRTQNYRIGILSNCQQFQIEYLLKNHPGFFDIFDHVFLSYKTGYLKPHKEAYDHAVIQSNLDINKILTIGDDINNDYKIPRKLGFPAIHFKDFNSLKKDMAKYGIVIRLS